MNRVIRQLAAMSVLCLGLAAPAWAQFTIPSGGSFDVPSGASVDVGCVPVEVEGALNVDSAQFSTSSSLNIAGTGTFNGNGGVLTVGGNLSNSGTFNASSGNVVLTDGCIGNTSQLSGNLVFQNLTLSSTTGRTFVIPVGTHITVLGTLTLQGASGQNIQIVSSGGGTAVITLGPSATVNQSFASVAGNVQIGGFAPPAAASIPTLGEYALLALALLMGLSALWHQRRGGLARRMD